MFKNFAKYFVYPWENLWHVASPGISLLSFTFLGEGALSPQIRR